MSALLTVLSDAMLTALALPVVTLSMAVPLVAALVIMVAVSIPWRSTSCGTISSVSMGR